MKRSSRYLLSTMVVLVVGAAIELMLSRTPHESKWQVRLVVWILFSQTTALAYLAVRATSLVREIRSQHRAATYVATIEGLWDALIAGVENGGLSPETRHAIYQAGKEQFSFYHAEVGFGDRRTLVFKSQSIEQVFDPEAV